MPHLVHLTLPAFVLMSDADTCTLRRPNRGSPTHHGRFGAKIQAPQNCKRSVPAASPSGWQLQCGIHTTHQTAAGATASPHTNVHLWHRRGCNSLALCARHHTADQAYLPQDQVTGSWCMKTAGPGSWLVCMQGSGSAPQGLLIAARKVHKPQHMHHSPP